MVVETSRPRIAAVRDAMAPFSRFFVSSAWSRRDPRDRRVCDFVFGNPHEMPLPGFVSSLQQWTPPRDAEWYAYKTSEQEPRAVVASSLRARYEMPFEDEDVALTNGAFAGLAVVLSAVVNPGEEVIFISPPWFFYEALIVHAGATPVRVPIDLATFDLDLDAIAAAVSERTRAIIVNSPHNPTGKIYPDSTLEQLAELLNAASQRYGRPIYLISDEAYSRIVFDGRDYRTPTAFYPHSFLVYTYGKTLLTPGQRIGYIALPPAMPEREQMRANLFAAQIASGWSFPNALLQHALPNLEELSIDIGHLQRKRDWMVSALRAIGYEVGVPEGTFYLLARSPWPDDTAFAELLAREQIYCLPGSVAELPGYIRISLTANESMIEQALPGFEAAWRQAAGAA
jgi:aspartate aminotransferase